METTTPSTPPSTYTATQAAPPKPVTLNDIAFLIKSNFGTEFVVLMMLAFFAFWRQVFTPLLINWTKRALGRRTYDADIRIQQILAECVGRTNACRAVFYEFHNGEKLASGRHYERMSITNQYCQKGSSPFDLHDTPISFLVPVLESLYQLNLPKNRAPLFITNLIQDDPDFHSALLLNYGVVAFIAYLISIDNIEVGLIELHFDDDENLTNESLSEVAIEVKPLVAQIQLEVAQASKPRLWRAFAGLLN